jgi:hypothetical protein
MFTADDEREVIGELVGREVARQLRLLALGGVALADEARWVHPDVRVRARTCEEHLAPLGGVPAAVMERFG